MLGYICNFHRSIEVTTSASGRDALRARLESRGAPRYDALLVNAFFACLLASVLPAASPRPHHRLCYSKQCNRCSVRRKNQ